MNKSSTRCGWAGSDPLMIAYHDKEWGVPQHDDIKLFEFLILEGAQAGLNWSTILNKREEYRKAFDGFDPKRIAKYKATKIKQLLNNPGIIRNKLKINSAVTNAKAFLKVQEEFGSFDKYLWEFVDNKPVVNKRKNLSQIPATSEISDKLSKDLLRRGFKFVGPTICYAFMQAIGVINDHTINCFRYSAILNA
jgi:DNA-3-methyladenine glycosylase I